MVATWQLDVLSEMTIIGVNSLAIIEPLASQ